MNFFKAIILGIIEGITEWIPISSTAHIKIFSEILSFEVSNDFFRVFEVVIQLGAIFALLIIFWNKIWPFGESKNPLSSSGPLKYVKKDKFILLLKMAVACIPVIIFELFLDNIFVFVNEDNEMTIIAIALIVIGLFFIIVELMIRNKKPTITSTKQISFTNAIIIGLSQLVAAVVPGVSRSGATIIAGLLMGLSRQVATEFTFELAIPVMFGASFMKMLDFGFAFSFSEVTLLLLSCAFAFIVSLFVIRFVIDYIKKNNYVMFGIYRIILGILILAFM